MAKAEAEDPEMQGRLAQAWAVAAPAVGETVSAIGDLPLAEGAKSIGRFAGDVKRGELGAGTGSYLGRIATQAVPAVVQQAAEGADRYEDGQSVRRDTRGTSFSEAFKNTVKEAIPGQREDLSIRTKPFGGSGTGVDVNDSPATSLMNPVRGQYEADDDPVAYALARYDAFPTPVRPLPGETQRDFNLRRDGEGAEEREMLERALQGDEEVMAFYAPSQYDAWEATGFTVPSPELTAVLRGITVGLRRKRTAERNRVEP
jgi:hypothetical protein